MRKAFSWLLPLAGLLWGSSGDPVIVRLPWEALQQAVQLRDLDPLGARPGEWADFLADPQTLQALRDQGIPLRITDPDPQATARQAALQYLTFPQVVDSLIALAQRYPTLTRLDTLGWTYENRPLLVLKISDDPDIEDPTEPDLLFMGLHHAREWPTVSIVLFLADSLLKGYGTDSAVTWAVQNRELFLFPVVNPDGYAYSHDQGHPLWRKNRRYFPQHGAFGVDLNRNYLGSENGDPEGMWGTTTSFATSHHPDADVYCGPHPFSEAETKAVRDLERSHDFVFAVSYHTYSELVLYPWGYGAVQTPDHTLIAGIAQEMASRITRQSGSGTYSPEPSWALYPASGDSDDWGYGEAFYTEGRLTIPFTVEAANEFQPPASALGQICRENFDGAFYLIEIADQVRNNWTPLVLPPHITGPDSVPAGPFTLTWTLPNPEAAPDFLELRALSGFSPITDDAEGGTGLWNLTGFAPSTSRAHSGTHSFRSPYVNNAVAVMETRYPLPVEPGDSLIFWTWYNIETDYDMAYVEVSTDGFRWELVDSLATFTGSSGGWVRKAYSLEPWAGQSVYLRFRYTTDGGVLREGFYVDDIFPVPSFASDSLLADTLTGTSYTITGLPAGLYFFTLRGHNARGYGAWGPLHRVAVGPVAVAERPEHPLPQVRLSGDQVLLILPARMPYRVRFYAASGRALSPWLQGRSRGAPIRLRVPESPARILFLRVVTPAGDRREKVLRLRR